MSNEPVQVKSFLVPGGRGGLFVYCELSCGEVGTIYPLVSSKAATVGFVLRL
jgi:hypothetical protein